MFAFRKGIVSFERPPKRQREGVPQTLHNLIQSGYSSQKDVAGLCGAGVFSTELAMFGRHLATETEARTVQSIQTGEYFHLFSIILCA